MMDKQPFQNFLAALTATDQLTAKDRRQATKRERDIAEAREHLVNLKRRVASLRGQPHRRAIVGACYDWWKRELAALQAGAGA